MQSRPYDGIASQLRNDARRSLSRDAAMQAAVDVLWDGLSPHDVSWAGFYTVSSDGRSLELGPHRDKPACSPIGLHGVCGRCYRNARPLIIDDVRTLGESYIACDPRDLSEVAVPVFDDRGRVSAVLDLDSFSVGAFTQDDVDGLRRVLSVAFGDAAVGPRR